MPQIVVFAEENLPIASSNGVAEDITVAPAFQHGHGDAKVLHRPIIRLVAEHLRHFRTAEPEDTAIMRDSYRTDRCQQRFAERRAKAALFIEGKDRAVGISRIKQPAVSLPGPDEWRLAPGIPG